MEISMPYMVILVIAMVVTVSFIITLRRGQQIMLIHKFYYAAAALLLIWLVSIFAIGFIPPEQIVALQLLDAATTMAGALIPACSLGFCICYTREFTDAMPRWVRYIFIVPILSTVMVFTNPLHHLYYEQFALKNSQVRFGPYFYIHSTYTYACAAMSIFLIIRYAIKTKSRLHLWQAILFTIGNLVPTLVNLLVTLRLLESNIALTPLCFTVTMVFHGIVIYRLHFFDIRPVALQHLLNWISDCYLVTGKDGRVVNFNRPFQDIFCRSYKVRENSCLSDFVSDEDVENKTPIYNLLSALRSCENLQTRITYEQPLDLRMDGQLKRYWYLVEVAPVMIKGNIGGYVSIFRDMTQIKLNMQKLADSQMKMMENERLAFLGQMVGGLAHNLKTPIMSISGSILAVEKLIEECRQSLGDPDVTEEDYREIYGEMEEWLGRMKEAGTYMSDIITAVKGQAANITVSEDMDFHLDDAMRRVQLLLRHELLKEQCRLVIDEKIQKNGITIHGDINNLVQVIGNLVSNAIDAQKPDGRHDIEIDTDWDDKEFRLTIKDYGTGIPKSARAKLFHQMVTSKGTKGTGLGIFISNSVIHAKFGGSMWYKDNPEGGSILGISLPLGCVTFMPKDEVIESA